MSDFEIFSGFEQGDQMDPASFERFKERMKANAAHIKALQKAEQKQKKKEGKLAQILLKFIKSSKKTDLVLLISRCLEKNIPAAFILSIVLLGNKEIQEEAGIKLALPGGEMFDMSSRTGDEASSMSSRTGNEASSMSSRTGNEASSMSSRTGNEALPIRDLLGASFGESRTIATFDDIEKVLPLRIRIQIDLWGKNMLETAQSIPHKILKTMQTIHFEDDKSFPKKSIEQIAVRLTSHVLHEFIQESGIESEITTMKQFAEFVLKGIIEQIERQIEEQKELEAGSQS